MGTLNFEAIPKYIAEDLAIATLQAVKQTMQTPEGRELLERRTKERKEKEQNQAKQQVK